MPSNEDRYATALQTNVRALWSSTITRAQFISLMMADIEHYLLLAWAEGAEEEDLVGLWDLTFEEASMLQAYIWMEYMFVDRFADDIVVQNQAAGFPLGPFIRRTDLWRNRFPSVRIRAQVMARADEKSEWRIAPLKEHCRTCVALTGIVKRNSFWNRTVLPRQGPNPLLECKGYQCGCWLMPTSEPVTAGPLPPLP